MAKLQPAVMTLTFKPGDKAESYYDISLAASLANRRFYRQGLNWAVAAMTVQARTATLQTGGIRTEILPTTWVTSNAWHKAFAMWNKQQSETMDDAGAESTRAKFADFKIFMDSAHVNAFYTAGGSSTVSNLNLVNEIPVDGGYVQFLTGEWEASQIVIPNLIADASGSEVDPYEYYLHMVGSNAGATPGRSRGIIDGYANSRSYPQSPDPVSSGVSTPANWMQQMFDVGNDDAEILANVVDKNDDLPYNQIEYPGGEGNASNLQIHSQHYLTSNSLGNRIDIRGTNVPCGLIKLSNDTGSDLEFQIHLVPGNHRGYLAEPMQDM